MILGETIILKGKTRHGKNRIQQHGCLWIISFITKFQGQPVMLLRSENKTEGPKGKKDFDARWVLLNNDPNFLIEKG